MDQSTIEGVVVPLAETPTICERCGDFKALQNFQGRQLCEACIERLREPLTVRNTFRVALPLGRASLIPITVNIVLLAVVLRVFYDAIAEHVVVPVSIRSTEGVFVEGLVTAFALRALNSNADDASSTSRRAIRNVWKIGVIYAAIFGLRWLVGWADWSRLVPDSVILDVSTRTVVLYGAALLGLCISLATGVMVCLAVIAIPIAIAESSGPFRSISESIRRTRGHRVTIFVALGLTFLVGSLFHLSVAAVLIATVDPGALLLVGKGDLSGAIKVLNTTVPNAVYGLALDFALAASSLMSVSIYSLLTQPEPAKLQTDSTA